MTETSVEKIFEMTSSPDELKLIRGKVTGLLAQSDLPQKAKDALLVVLGEACTNAIRHAYGNQPGHKIIVTYREDGAKVVLIIRDFGKKIDLAKVPKPQLPPQKGGGLGIYFMETMTDKMQYNTAHAEGNELILTKFKEKGAPSNPAA